jgi:hypothetical protein
MRQYWFASARNISSIARSIMYLHTKWFLFQKHSPIKPNPINLLCGPYKILLTELLMSFKCSPEWCFRLRPSLPAIQYTASAMRPWSRRPRAGSGSGGGFVSLSALSIFACGTFGLFSIPNSIHLSFLGKLGTFSFFQVVSHQTWVSFQINEHQRPEHDYFLDWCSTIP